MPEVAKVVTPLIDGLLALQLLQVLFLGLHDWVPLGRFNDVKSVQAADPRDRLIRVTLISTLPYAFGLAASLRYAAGFPGWLIDWLWVTYALLFVGQLRAWWLPYLLVPDPVRAARYRTMSRNPHPVGVFALRSRSLTAPREPAQGAHGPLRDDHPPR